MGAHLPDLHIAVMGMEKLVPDADSAALLMRMLARNATGQPSTSYNSIFGAPRPGAELHVVIVDNGRSRRMADRRHAEIYKCIRCGACINTCPVYRRGGGHSYDYFIPGPIGLAIAGDNPEANSEAWACTLNGSCNNVCPVKVPLRETIAYHREQLAQQKKLPYGKNAYMPLVGKMFGSSRRLSLAMAAARLGLRILPRSLHRHWEVPGARAGICPSRPPELRELVPEEPRRLTWPARRNSSPRSHPRPSSLRPCPR